MLLRPPLVPRVSKFETTQSSSRFSAASLAPGKATLNMVVIEIASVSYRRRMNAWRDWPGCECASALLKRNKHNKSVRLRMSGRDTHNGDLDSADDDVAVLPHDRLELDQVGSSGTAAGQRRASWILIRRTGLEKGVAVGVWEGRPVAGEVDSARVRRRVAEGSE